MGWGQIQSKNNRMQALKRKQEKLLVDSGAGQAELLPTESETVSMDIYTTLKRAEYQSEICFELSDADSRRANEKMRSWCFVSL